MRLLRRLFVCVVEACAVWALRRRLNRYARNHDDFSFVSGC